MKTVYFYFFFTQEAKWKPRISPSTKQTQATDKTMIELKIDQYKERLHNIQHKTFNLAALQQNTFQKD